MTITAKEANALHARWMALDMNDPEEVKNQFFIDYEARPKKYISVNGTLDQAVVVIDGSPLNQEVDLEAALLIAIRNDVQTDLWWQGYHGKWIAGCKDISEDGLMDLFFNP